MTTAEYPGALCMPAHPSNYRHAGRQTVQRVVIHATDGRSVPQHTAEMWQQPGHGSSAHFVIGQDGTVVQSVSVADIAWHAHAANALSVGIEHCARTPGELNATDAGLPASAVQLAASAKLTAWLCQRFGIAPSRSTIVGHHECDPETTHADCPTGAGIVLDDYAATVQALMAPAG